jgi:hypothetical protein
MNGTLFASLRLAGLRAAGMEQGYGKGYCDEEHSRDGTDRALQAKDAGEIEEGSCSQYRTALHGITLASQPGS